MDCIFCEIVGLRDNHNAIGRIGRDYIGLKFWEFVTDIGLGFGNFRDYILVD